MGRVMNLHAKVLTGLFITIAIASRAHAVDQLDQWTAKLDAHCLITPQSTAGKEIPSMLFEVKEHIFDAAGAAR